MLLSILKLSETHHIKCIKPNNVKKPNIFEPKIVMQQLHYSGAFDAIKSYLQGFPFRITHAEFLEEYRILEKGFHHDEPSKERIEAIIKRLYEESGRLHFSPSSCAIGTTMVFFKEMEFYELKTLKIKTYVKAIERTGRIVRGYLYGRRFLKLLKKAKAEIKESCDKSIEDRKTEEIEEVMDEWQDTMYAPYLQRDFEHANKVSKKITYENNLRNTILNLFTKDAREKLRKGGIAALSDENDDFFVALESNKDFLEYVQYCKESKNVFADDPTILDDLTLVESSLEKRKQAKTALENALSSGFVEKIENSIEHILQLRETFGKCFLNVNVDEARKNLKLIKEEEERIIELRKSLKTYVLKPYVTQTFDLKVEMILTKDLEYVYNKSKECLSTISGKRILKSVNLILGLRKELAKISFENEKNEDVIISCKRMLASCDLDSYDESIAAEVDGVKEFLRHNEMKQELLHALKVSSCKKCISTNRMSDMEEVILFIN